MTSLSKSSESVSMTKKKMKDKTSTSLRLSKRILSLSTASVSRTTSTFKLIWLKCSSSYLFSPLSRWSFLALMMVWTTLVTKLDSMLSTRSETSGFQAASVVKVCSIGMILLARSSFFSAKVRRKSMMSSLAELCLTKGCRMVPTNILSSSVIKAKQLWQSLNSCHTSSSKHS